MVIGLAAIASWTLGASAVDAQPGVIADEPDALVTSTTNGPVHDVETNGHRTLLSGDFSSVGPATLGGAVVSPSSAAPLKVPVGMPETDAVAASPRGGWFVATAGTVRAVTPDGRLDPDFLVETDQQSPLDTSVFALVVSPDGGTLYIGGKFGMVAGHPRAGVAAVSTADGRLLDWHPDIVASISSSATLRLSPDGTRLLVGSRVTIDGVDRSVVELSASTGEVLRVGPDGWSTGVAMTAGGDVFLSHREPDFGEFSVMALDESMDVRWRVYHEEGGVPTSLHVDAARDRLLVSGDFDRIADVARDGMAALDLETGEPTDWRSDLPGGILAAAPDGETLYLSGDLRSGARAIRTSDGAALPWSPGWVQGVVRGVAVAADGDEVFVAGWMTSLYGRQHGDAGQLDESGAPMVWWAAGPAHQTGGVTATALGEDGIAYWSSSDRRTGSGAVAAVDEGPAARWQLDIEGSADAIALSPDGETLYLAGSLQSVGGVPRQGLAAVRTADGGLLDWAPQIAGGAPVSLAVSSDGTRVMVGGDFASVDGIPRANLAEVGTEDADVTAFAPDPDDAASAVAYSPDGERAYVGGDFTHIGGRSIDGLAALRTSDGGADDWNPRVGAVRDLAVSPDGSLLVVGGSFSTVGAATGRRGVAAFETTTGALLPWNPRLSVDYITAGQRAVVDAVAFSPAGTELHIGGAFTSLGEFAGLPDTRAHYARFGVGLSRGLPVNSRRPHVERTDPSTLTCDPGYWQGRPSRFTYAWFVDGEQVEDYDGRDLPHVAERDAEVTCRVTGTNQIGSASAGSDDPEPIPTPTPTPTIEPAPDPVRAATAPGGVPLAPEPIAPLPPRVRVLNTRMHTVLAKGVRVRVLAAASQTFRVEIRASGRSKRIAARSVRVHAGKARTVRVRPRGAARRWLRQRRQPVRLRALLLPTAGHVPLARSHTLIRR